MKRGFLGVVLVTGFVAGILLVRDPRYEPSRHPLPALEGSLAWAAQTGGGSCSLCHDVHGGGGMLLKPHPYPKEHPLDCFSCHMPDGNLGYEYDPDECFSCHEAGGEHAGLTDLGCFDCHGPHDPNRAPNFSTQTNCFRCHEVTMP